MLYQSALGQVSMQADRVAHTNSGAKGRVRVRSELEAHVDLGRP
jgi:hypothetical protein